MDKKLEIGIVGAGGIGKTLATTLMSFGHSVEVVSSRLKGIKIDNSYACDIRGDFGNKTYLVPIVDSIDNFSTKKDIIIFALKSYEMLEKLKDSFALLKPTGTIVTIQNVLTIDRVMRIIPDESSVCMLLDFAAKDIENYTYVKDFGGITLGVYNKIALPRMQQVKRVFEDICKVKTTNDVVGFLTGRAIINSAISVLGAMSGMCLGEILRNHNGRFLFVKMIEEAIYICKKYRINVLPYNNKLDYYKFVEKSFGGWRYRYKILRLLRKENYYVMSSALQDLENGEKTEVVDILNRFVKMSQRIRVKVPYITEIYNIMKEIEGGERRINEMVFYDKNLVELSRQVP